MTDLPTTDDRQIDLLDGVLRRTTELLAGAADRPATTPTPCTGMDLGALIDHVVAWAEVFAAGASGTPYDGDPLSVHVEPADAAGRFAAAADRIVVAWRRLGLDRDVQSFSGGTFPGRMAFGMTAMEYLAHGCDIAAATGQEPGFDPAAATLALDAAHQFLLPEYRGPESFGEIVPVPDDAPVLDRFLGFLGRRPLTA
jgi:uncharacterized protein (TIGR03086 family)